jgi:hypothetical protein
MVCSSAWKLAPCAQSGQEPCGCQRARSLNGHPVGRPSRGSVFRNGRQKGRLFALERSGEKLYPLYVFGPDFTPVLAIKAVLDVFPSRSPLATACFFESTSSFLGGRRPRELLNSEPGQVIAHALDEREWLEFGG